VDNNQIILQHLMKISEDLGSIKSDISNLSESVSTHIKKDEETQKELQDKVSILEDQHKRVKWLAAGAGAVIAGLWKVAEAFISNLSGHH
jgi:hypothetical protein